MTELAANSTLRVCFAISGPNTRGGIERHVYDLSKGLVGASTEVFVLAHESYADWFPKAIQYCPVSFDRWRFDPRLLDEVVKNIRKVRPSIVHAHGRKAAQVVSLVRNQVSSRRILTVHNTNIKAKYYRHFHEVIAVSSTVAATIEHPRLFVIPNGC